jgi:hypothetical protein
MKKIIASINFVLVASILVSACGQTPEPTTVTQKSKAEAPKSKEQKNAPTGTARKKDWGPSSSNWPSGESAPPAALLAPPYAQEINMPHQLKTIPVNRMVTLPVVVRNTSRQVWQTPATSKEKQHVNLSYHWLEGETKRQTRRAATAPNDRTPDIESVPIATSRLQSEQVVVMDGQRTPLPRDIQPGEEVTLNAKIQAPNRPGDYTLRLTMVQERVAWFENYGAQPLDISVKVTPQ